MLDQRVFDRALKLLALADRPGTPAEGESARRLLDRLISQYEGLTLALLREALAVAHQATEDALVLCVRCMRDLPDVCFRWVKITGRAPYQLWFCRACEVEAMRKRRAAKRNGRS